MEDILVVKHIKELLTQKGWTTYKLAKKANIPYSSLNTMLKHGHIPTTNNLIKICEGLGISLSQFFLTLENDQECVNKEQELLNIWHTLNDRQQELVITYMHGLAGKERKISKNDIR